MKRVIDISVKSVWPEFMHCIRGRQTQLFGARLEKVTSRGTWPSYEQLVLFITRKRQCVFPELNSGRHVKHYSTFLIKSFSQAEPLSL